MKLVTNWRAVLARAWSVRLVLLSAAITGAGVALPNTIGLSWPDAARVIVGGVIVSVFAVVARIIDQPNSLPGGGDGDQ